MRTSACASARKRHWLQKPGSPPIRRQENTEHPGREETQGWGAPGRSRRSSMWGRTEERGKGGGEGEEEKGEAGTRRGERKEEEGEE